MSKKQFRLTQDHIELLQHVNIRWSDAVYGAPGVDTKRPFGNSGFRYIEREICEYLGLEPLATDDVGRDIYDDEERQEAVETYNELDTALAIVLRCQTFTPGLFETSGKYKRDWHRMAVEHGDNCPICGHEVSLSIAGQYGEYKCPECEAVYELEIQ